MRPIRDHIRSFLSEPRHVVTSLRLLVFAGLAVLGWSGPPIEPLLFWCLTIVYGLTVGGYLAASNGEFDLPRVRIAIFLFDVAVVTALVVVRGRDVQALVMAYFTLVLLTGVLAGLGGAFLSASVASALYIIATGWGRPPAALLTYEYIGAGAFFVVISMFMAHMAADARRRSGRAPRLRTVSLQHSTDRLRATRDGMRAEERLRTLSMLCAGISHEVRGPLGALRDGARESQGLLDMLAGDDTDARQEALEELRALLDDCGHAATQLQHVAGDLNQLGRDGSSHVRPVSAHEMMQGAVRLLRGSLAADVRLHTDVRTGRCVHGDAGRLVHALVILAANAIEAQHAAGGGIITLAVDGIGASDVEIRVEDTGPGMAPDVLERIYDPFFTTKGPGRGTGLGLYVAREIVRAQGGTIECRSAPGEGTRFRLQLPAIVIAEGSEAA